MQAVEEVIESKRTEAKPWLRFLARKIDMVIYLIIAIIPIMLLFFVLGFFGVNGLSDDDSFFSLLFGLIFILIMIMIESIMLFWWETTPGKKLLKIKIHKENGESFNFGDTLERTTRLWFSGLGLGLPIISILAQIVAYANISEEGIASWDKKAKMYITHDEISNIRVVIAIAVAAIFVGIEIYANIALT